MATPGSGVAASLWSRGPATPSRLIYWIVPPPLKDSIFCASLHSECPAPLGERRAPPGRSGLCEP
ncbi:hypothetical protein EYF80_061461 [Liparis tanakae]|uniref:Uncharacterized protein n=1 Tax=Liparis tanakae TaxID=230148 RepID=A0A4Z2EJ76_9TELE|nr:hypothetical protein EYF80_061461 [Liparis tanakae]